MKCLVTLSTILVASLIFSAQESQTAHAQVNPTWNCECLIEVPIGGGHYQIVYSPMFSSPTDLSKGEAANCSYTFQGTEYPGFHSCSQAIQPPN